LRNGICSKEAKKSIRMSIVLCIRWIFTYFFQIFVQWKGACTGVVWSGAVAWKEHRTNSISLSSTVKIERS